MRIWLSKIRCKPGWTSFICLAVVVLLSCLNGGSLRDIIDSRNFAQPFSSTLHSSARWLAWGVAAATVFGISLLLVFPRVRKPHYSFLLMVLLVGPFYVFSLTPLSPADEKFHWEQTLQAAVRISRNLSVDESLSLDMFRPNNRNLPEGYVRLANTFRLPNRKAGTIDWGDKRWEKHGTWAMHSTQIAGVIAGLQLGAPPLAVFYLGRIFSLLAYAGIVFWAIRSSPFFNRSLAVAASCPIAMQQVCSYSYDAESLTMSFLCFALAAKNISENEKPFDCITGLCMIAAVAVGMSMKCAAFPFLPLLFLLPTSRFRSGMSGKLRFLFLVATVALGMALTCFSVTPSALWNKPLGELAYGGSSWTPALIASNPLKVCFLLLNSFDLFGQILLYDAFGGNMSGLSLRLYTHITMIFIVMFFIAAFKDGEEIRFRPVARLRMAAACGWILLTVYLFFIMLTCWTPDSSTTILGLQGRYWTPVLPLAAVALFARNKEPGSDGLICRGSGSIPEIPFDRFLFPIMMLAHCDAIICIVKATLKN